MSYVKLFYKGVPTMWFVAHTGTPGCDNIVSVDFEKNMEVMALPDEVIAQEWYELMTVEEAIKATVVHAPPRVEDVVTTTAVLTVATAVVADYIRPPPLKVPLAAPPPSPKEEVDGPAPPPPSPTQCGSSDSGTPKLPRIRKTRHVDGDKVVRGPFMNRWNRKRHTLLTDAIIIKYVDCYGPKWRDLARSMGGRDEGWSDDTVRNRYIRIVESEGGKIYKRQRRTTEFKKPSDPIIAWTEEEDTLLAKLWREEYRVESHGMPWKKISGAFNGQRTQQAIRNRANRLGFYKHNEVATKASS